MPAWEVMMALDVNMGMECAEANLSGEFTIFTVGVLKDDFFGLLNFPVVHLYLAQVTEFDTAGLQLLVMLQREALLRERKLQLIAPSVPVQDVVTLLGCNDLFAFNEPTAGMGSAESKGAADGS
ncbi:STAS domain-containing protein [Chitinimonas sp. PSY-7]|uniref:STAS domain-containing protein n=1 Tax=Chitinimonas sp. PSY-7 TaxID=3459088 RepID=UPI0040400E19